MQNNPIKINLMCYKYKNKEEQGNCWIKYKSISFIGGKYEFV